ncbi:hypothetical protein A3K86_13205 [Photobacterium jeanii]|uniref:ATP-grasp domain-containing protein n=1 Tax=Photobacterium jeanii TaxID=858640 RepID=A0A178K885_9GAMM|nr:hypothetical protein [Photobacterium jeanii]OAN13540.1 hypothetical protein A3K86_13205 [Photobacterium jeanii]PST88655.1 hypothetical protein C9I91_15055 [Photobacterium jeanii]
MKLGILIGFNPDDENNYINACKELNVDYTTINFIDTNWLDLVKNSDCDGFLARPPCVIQERKSLYDERLYFLNKIMGKDIYPSFDELFIYENKRNMYSWLDLYGYPHAKTNVFFKKSQALSFINETSYPIITKSNIGASSAGVSVLKNKREAKAFINSVFGYFNNNLVLGKSPLSKRFVVPVPLIGQSQRQYALFQEWIEMLWEWRIIKIGDSLFGYKKLLGSNGLASGNNLDGWAQPPKKLLDMVSQICDDGKFHSMAVDIFETKNGEYYVNELQSIFGSYNPSQMYINDKPCRFVKTGDDYELEEGFFCQNGCANLRVEHFVKLLNSK